MDAGGFGKAQQHHEKCLLIFKGGFYIMRRSKEQSEAVVKLKELQMEHSSLSERFTVLSSLLRQQWENYRKTRYRQDLMLLITILHEANLVREQLVHNSHCQTVYDEQLKQKPSKPSARSSVERLKVVNMELKELNKKRKEAEKEEAAVIDRCASVIEFMDLNDVYAITCNKIEVLTTEKKMLQQMLKKKE